MEKSDYYLIFTIENEKYAISVSSVERIFRIVNITPLPKAPEIILGVINIHGLIVPVINLRSRLGLPLRDTSLSDQLILVKRQMYPVAIPVDNVTDIIEKSEKDLTLKDELSSRIKYIKGIIKLQDDLILINNIDDFLSMEEENILKEVI